MDYQTGRTSTPIGSRAPARQPRADKACPAPRHCRVIVGAATDLAQGSIRQTTFRPDRFVRELGQQLATEIKCCSSYVPTKARP